MERRCSDGAKQIKVPFFEGGGVGRRVLRNKM